MRFLIAAGGYLALSILTAAAQTPADAPEFEVASVKPAANPPSPVMLRMRESMGPMAEKMGFNGGPGTKDPGRLTCTAVSLKMLLVRAYKVRPYQIVGPTWIDSAFFDITAKIAPGTTEDQFRLMLQKLLTDRFRIQLHRDTKEFPQYRLTVAKGGPKLSPPETAPVYKDDAERSAAMQKQIAAMQKQNMDRMASGPTGPHSSMHVGSGTVAKLAESLSAHLDHPVVDMTGLDGLYSYTLAWSPDNGQTVSDGSAGPSLAAAVQEQLGLKLEPAKGPLEIIVIDKVEKSPIEN